MALNTGYPSWMQEDEDEIPCDEDGEDYDEEFWGDEYEDSAYEERREQELFGED